MVISPLWHNDCIVIEGKFTIKCVVKSIGFS